MRRAARAACLLLVAGTSFAHPAPNSILRLEFEPEGIRAEYWVPVSELAHARAASPVAEPFSAYLLRHFGVETPTGTPWRVIVGTVRDSRYFDHPYLVADIRLVPPAGASARDFILVDDTVTHEVRNHVLYVVAQRGEQSDLIGALQFPARRLPVTAR